MSELVKTAGIEKQPAKEPAAVPQRKAALPSIFIVMTEAVEGQED